MKKRIVKHPLIIIVFVVIGCELVLNIGAALFHKYFSVYSTVFVKMVADLILILFALIIIRTLLKEKEIMKTQGFYHGFLLGIPFIFICVLLYIIPAVYNWPNEIELIFSEFRTINDLNRYMILVAIESIIVGFAEELAFRGIIFHSLASLFKSPKVQLWVGVLGSALLFGGWHISVAKSRNEAIILCLGTFFFGIFLASIYVITKNIWIVALLHGFWNFSTLIIDKVSDIQTYFDKNIHVIFTGNIGIDGVILNAGFALIGITYLGLHLKKQDVLE